MSAWPAAVWSAAVLRGLDARARSELASAGTLRDARRGEAIYRPGEPADLLYVVADGAVAVRGVRRGDVESSLIRDARRGDAFGEEATLGVGMARRMEARAIEDSRIAGIPALVLRRALARAGGEDAHGEAARVERTLRRAATSDLLRITRFASALADPELEALVDAVGHVELARGDALFRAGDPATHAYLVASGMMQLQTEDLGRVQVRAYVGEGDLLGDEEIEAGAPRSHAAVAAGPAWILTVPRAALLSLLARHPHALARARRVRGAQEAIAERIAGHARTTQHVFRDLYRLHVARSLLVIDQDACVRCGHCASSCGDAHEGGVSRLLRRGDKILAHAGESGVKALLVPNSCQHCESPSCMRECPTGAIGRDLRGEVFIREDLCTGCGSCAKGCPWENIQLAPRAAPRTLRAGEPLSAEIAVKCDLCHGREQGPACVAACPTQAIARIDPNEALVELRALRGDRRPPSPMPRPLAAWPWLGLGAGLGLLVMRLGSAGTFASGAVAGVAIAALAAYGAIKRAMRVARLRPWLVAHLTMGAIAIGAVLAHAGLRVPPTVAGGLAVATWGALLTGGFGALAYRLLPPRLTRIERGGALPEDLPPRARALEERAFAQLTGKSELVKAIYARILRPFARAPLGPIALVASGRTLRAEEQRLTAKVERAVAGRGGEKLDGLPDLVRIVVEQRALAGQRLVQTALRGWLPLHLALSAIALVLLVVHVVLAVAYR